MNIIQQQREEIIKNNNVAQQQLADYISTILSNATIELKFSSPFHGSLDLGVLDDKKFENLRSIVFSEGEITNITNIPKTLNTLIVPNNLLTELENLPSNLIELNINKNYFKTLDVSYLPDIEILHCDENKLKKGVLPYDRSKVFAPPRQDAWDLLVSILFQRNTEMKI